LKGSIHMRVAFGSEGDSKRSMMRIMLIISRVMTIYRRRGSLRFEATTMGCY
jgi:hypothetical protein